MNAPQGFTFSGLNAGIKPQRKDLALVLSDSPCAAAGCFTVNRAKAAPVVDAEKRLPAGGVRAVVINSGNANALTGPAGLEDVEAIRVAAAAALQVDASAVLTASTGVIGVRMPAGKVVTALPALAAAAGPDPALAAEAIMTTDTRMKMATRALRLGEKEVTLTAICKGSGMIAPQLATMIAVVTTDCAIHPELLQRALRQAMEKSFNSLTVDNDMSTNDAVFALANGRAGNPLIQGEGPDLDRFLAALESLCVELAREIAADGEGATKLFEVEVQGAPTFAVAQDLARSIAGSSLVKAAIFGADPNWGRILATVGARAGSQGFDGVNPYTASVDIQGIRVYDGCPAGHDVAVLKARMREPVVRTVVALKGGEATSTAWGCDLSYDYVKINADYTSLIVQTPDGGVAKDDRLSNYTPAFKVSLLVEALSYIARFAGKRCVIRCGPEAVAKDSLKHALCEDLNLLRSVGLKPILVLPAKGPPAGALNQDLVALLNRRGSHAVGVSAHDGGFLKGDPPSVKKEFLELLLQQDYLPVISAEGLDEDGVAAAVAGAAGAAKLIFLNGVPGYLEGEELVSELSAAELEVRLSAGRVPAPLLGKARASLAALGAGVEGVHLVDGRTPHSVIAELFTDRGVGSLVKKA
ncbi:MAG TPA: bifunctional glutamate N-acetyltransferase/amino-acid acetyltransferase ArgJ [Myxococcales bacterium]|nr:bifunctional glutamate N-acetyltransferase/amino-acid acetyltransferase ArgJ [Myxococcales bacterium]